MIKLTFSYNIVFWITNFSVNFEQAAKRNNINLNEIMKSALNHKKECKTIIFYPDQRVFWVYLRICYQIITVYDDLRLALCHFVHIHMKKVSNIMACSIISYGCSNIINHNWLFYRCTHYIVIEYALIVLSIFNIVSKWLTWYQSIL